jgi:hypothetical protein
MDLQKYFLHHVVDVPTPTEQALDEARNITSMSPKQLVKRLPVASLAAQDEHFGLDHGT